MMTKVSNGLWTNFNRKKEESNKSFSPEYALDEEDKQQKTITDLHRRLCHRQDPENFITLNTINRYLQAYRWNIDEAEGMILRTLEWRTKHQPQQWQCKWCIETPGYHAWRQVGFDKEGRPVIYSCFAQEQAKNDTIEDTIVHMVYLIENAIATMSDSNCTWIWVLDCTGIKISSSCSKLNAKVMNLLSNHYPCRLGQLLCINYNWIFSSIWSTVKLFLTQQTISKVRLVTPAQLKPLFKDIFSISLCDWLLDEIELNKSEQLSQSQTNFWMQPSQDDKHDPRGCQDYIARYLNRGKTMLDSTVQTNCTKRIHLPHPNMCFLTDHSYAKNSNGVNTEQMLELVRAALKDVAE